MRKKGEKNTSIQRVTPEKILIVLGFIHNLSFFQKRNFEIFVLNDQSEPKAQTLTISPRVHGTA